MGTGKDEARIGFGSTRSQPRLSPSPYHHTVTITLSVGKHWADSDIGRAGDSGGRSLSSDGAGNVVMMMMMMMLETRKA